MAKMEEQPNRYVKCAVFFDLLRKIKEKSRLAELLRELEKECDFGRLPEERCVALRQKYEEELKRLEEADSST
jgi:hypothetical protein